MKKIIGGILLVVLMSQPSYLVFGAVAVQLDQGHEKRIVSILQEDGIIVQSQMINGYMDSIQSGSDEIYRLIERKKENIEKIDGMMKEMARNNETLSFDLIQSYKAYCTLKEDEELKVRSALYAVEDMYKLTAAQQEIMKADTDYEFVESELKKIDDKQQEIITSLNKIIASGDGLLEAFAQAFETEFVAS